MGMVCLFCFQIDISKILIKLGSKIYRMAHPQYNCFTLVEYEVTLIGAVIYNHKKLWQKSSYES